MSYEGWEYGYVAGAAGALAYVAVNPVIGYTIAAAITSLASKPSNLTGAADRWDEIAKGVNGIGAELNRHVAAVPADDWTAQDAEAFKQAVQLVLDNIGQGAGVHVDTGKIMHGLAKLSFYGAQASIAVGALLTALTIYTLSTRAIPGVNVATQASSDAAATGVRLMVGGLVKKFGLAAFLAMSIYTLVQSKQAELEAQIASLGAHRQGLPQLRIPLSNLELPGGAAQPNGPPGAPAQAGGDLPYA